MTFSESTSKITGNVAVHAFPDFTETSFTHF